MEPIRVAVRIRPQDASGNDAATESTRGPVKFFDSTVCMSLDNRKSHSFTYDSVRNRNSNLSNLTKSYTCRCIRHLPAKKPCSTQR